MWEYLKRDLNFKTNQDLTKMLNEFGKENWEVVDYKEEQQINYNENRTVKILFKRKPA